MGLLKYLFILLLTSVVNASNHAKCISLNNQQYMTLTTFIKLYPNEYSQGLRYYPFAANLDVLEVEYSYVCVAKKPEDLN